VGGAGASTMGSAAHAARPGKCSTKHSSTSRHTHANQPRRRVAAAKDSDGCAAASKGQSGGVSGGGEEGEESAQYKKAGICGNTRFD